ncbi:MAG: Rieske 2Fe-2S domain-containing protein [Pseudomonadota bacterium]
MANCEAAWVAQCGAARNRQNYRLPARIDMNTHSDESPLPIETNSSKSVTVEGRNLILVDHGGALFLYENNCPHAQETLDPLGGNLSNGGGELFGCQRHGAQFVARTGECVAGPCQGEQLTGVAFTAVGDAIYLD